MRTAIWVLKIIIMFVTIVIVVVVVVIIIMLLPMNRSHFCCCSNRTETISGPYLISFAARRFENGTSAGRVLVFLDVHQR
jgi:hypothetical protein